MSKEQYSSFITSHRIASGFKTQKDFAEATGITRATISRMEAGLNRPSPETLQALAKKLHTTSYTELMVVCGYWDEDELLEPINFREHEVKYNITTKETPSQDIAIEKEFSTEDLNFLNEFKKLADDLELDLKDPKTIEVIKNALDLIKRVRGE